MVKAIALHSVVPLRVAPSETSEQETQMLFAQTCVVMEECANWLRVKNDADGAEGWADKKMLTQMNAAEWKSFSKSKKNAMVRMPMAYAVSNNNGQTLPLSAGSQLPNYANGQFEILGVTFRIDPSMVLEQALTMNEGNLLEVVRFFLNTPYLWGGKNAFGMDCSGFVQIIHSLFGHQLPRNASEQAREGEMVADLSDAQAGDLVFFDHEDNHITHVGIIIDNSRVIHCSGRVKVERLDADGIFSVESGNIYTHHLACIKRL